MAPEYKKAAEKLAGLVKVVAVDCDQDANKQLCAMHQIQGFPTIKLFPGGKKTIPEDYQGPRTAAALVQAAIQKIKSFSHPLHEPEKISKWMGAKIAKVLLVSEKAEPSPMYKSLSADFYNRLKFGHVLVKDQGLIDHLPALDTFPSIVVFPTAGDPVIYTGTMICLYTAGCERV